MIYFKGVSDCELKPIVKQALTQEGDMRHTYLLQLF